MDDQAKSFTFVETPSQRIADLVEGSRLSRTQIASEIGISDSALSNYCRDRTPKADELFRIAKYFGVPMDSFFQGGGMRQEMAGHVQEMPALYGGGRVTKRDLVEAKREIDAVVSAVFQRLEGRL